MSEAPQSAAHQMVKFELGLAVYLGLQGLGYTTASIHHPTYTSSTAGTSPGPGSLGSPAAQLPLILQALLHRAQRFAIR